MKIIKTEFKDLLTINCDSHIDSRGCFSEIYREDKLFDVLGYRPKFCQDNLVQSKKNVLRGLHFQSEKYSQSKLISVFDGKILDVVVDLRKTSKTYLKHFKIVLSSKLKNSLFIPKGFAHGYLVRSSFATIHYKVDQYYNKSSEAGIPFNDKFLNIDWGIDENTLVLSEKDKNLKNFDW